MGEAVLHRAFASGELDPGLSARGDLEAYGKGLRTCRNFVVRRSGGAQSRPGLEHVATAKLTSETVLFAFIFAGADDSYVVEAGDFYFRFHHRLRGMVLELPTPYPKETLYLHDRLCWSQSEGVVSLTHLGYPPMELVYGGPDTFTLQPVVIAPGIATPNQHTGTAGAPGTLTLRYQVTAVKQDTYEESLPSPLGELPGTLMGTPELPNVIEWNAVPGAVEYKVYRDDGQNDTFGYIGTATGESQESFRDIGLAPDPAFTPPQPRLGLFDAPLQYPALAVMHQQRRVFVGTHTRRDIAHASRTGLPSNFTFRSPYQDDDAITWRTVSRDFQVVRHLLSLGPLILLTDRGEWVLRGDSDGGLTPTTLYPEQQGYVGAGWATPAIYGDRVLFVQARDTVVREFVVNQQTEGLSGRDLTRAAAHLFRGRRILSIGFALEPDAVLWCVRDDGVLLGLTYIPDEDVLAWHQHDTEGGLFESVVVVPELTEDAVYVVVNRDGTRSLERLGVRDDVAHAATLDRMVRYRGPATTIVGGLAHLVGRTVRVLASGTTAEAVVSAAGEVTLPTPREVVDVGLPITADLETLELDVAGSDLRDRRKKVTTLAILVEQSLQNFFVGPDADHLKPVQAAPWQAAGALFTGRVELNPVSTFNDEGRVFLRHTAPTTLTVLGLIPHVDIGG